RQQDHRKMLIDAFINTIYLYDDRIVITFNYKEGTKTVSFDDVKESLSGERSSDLDSSAVLIQRPPIRKQYALNSVLLPGRGSFFTILPLLIPLRRQPPPPAHSISAGR
ncbi:MAG: hypothetical protein ACI4L8_03085, partial [Candidatus Fimadaptatus sp.]